MSKENLTNFTFSNDILHFESLPDKFNDQIDQKLKYIDNKIDIKKKIENLISGNIVNISEKQSALHPRYRGYFDGQELPKLLRDAEIKAGKFFKKHFDFCIDNGFKEMNVVTLGIGGSYEGPKLLLESINNPMIVGSSNLLNANYVFITGSDNYEFNNKIKFLTPDNTIFIVSSKSFTTDETIESLKKALSWSKDKNKFIAITVNSCEVEKYGIKNVITFDKEIGGRYSIWSPITQFHLSGNHRKNFLKGGLQADIDILNNQKYLNFIKRLSFSDIFYNDTGKSTRAILSYVWSLRSLPNYFQQLEMEYLGKRLNPDSEFKKTGQIVFGGYGPTAQHSYFQLMHQGTQDLCADIIASAEDLDNLAYVQAITQAKILSSGESEIKLENESKINGNVPINLFILNELNSYSLGYLIATWEYRTYITAVILGINPFDQFGVNAGKIYTKKYLAEKD